MLESVQLERGLNYRINFRGNPLEVIGFLDNVTGDLGTWVSDGNPPAGRIRGAIQGRYREACDSWSNGLQWTKARNPSGRRVMSNLCDPWLSSQGSGDPVLDAPYTGGQCPLDRERLARVDEGVNRLRRTVEAVAVESRL